MRASLSMALGLTAAALLGGPAVQAAPERTCFRMSQLESTRPAGDQTIYFRVGLHDFYRLDLAYRCPDLNAREGIILTPAGGQDEICSPLELDVRARLLGGGSVPCLVKSITRLTPAEARALPAKVKP